MSAVTHDEIDHIVRLHRPRHNKRSASQSLLRRAAAMLIGGAVMIAVVAATIALKVYVLLPHLPLAH